MGEDGEVTCEACGCTRLNCEDLNCWRCGSVELDRTRLEMVPAWELVLTPEEEKR